MNIHNIPLKGILGKLFRNHGGTITIILLLVIFGPLFLQTHLHTIYSPLVLDDMRPQIPPFFRYVPEAPSLTNDYIADYYLATYPLGYKAIYIAWSQFADPRLLAKLLHPFLQLVTLVAMGISAFRIGRWPAVFVVCALMMSGGAFFAGIIGGLPRSFGLPVVAITVAGLLYGSTRWMLAGVVLGALFYPVSGVLSGVILALHLFVKSPGFVRATVRDKCTRAGLVVLAAVLGFVCLLPTMIVSAQYGRGLKHADAVEYPEIGSMGAGRGITKTYMSGYTLRGIVLNTLIGYGAPINPWYMELMHTNVRLFNFPVPAPILLAVALTAVAGGLRRLLVGDPVMHSLCVLAAAILLGFMASLVALPYLYIPNRYPLLGVPILTLLGLVAGLGAFRALVGEREGRQGWQRLWYFVTRHSTLVAAAVLLLTVGSFGQRLSHFNLESPKHFPGVYNFLSHQPADSLVAGWPAMWGGIQSPVESVAYFSRQPVLMSYETHVVFQTEFLKEIRQRTFVLADAFLSPDTEGLVRLVEDYEVKFLIVDLEKLENPTRQSFYYFEPFESHVANLLAELDAGKTPALVTLLEQYPEAIVYQENTQSVVDLPELLELAGLGHNR